MKKQMKRISVVTLICMLVCTVSCLLPAHAEEQPITVFIDGVQVQFDVNPQIENDRTLVPMRAIFEALGAVVTWDEATETATAVRGEDTISLSIDNPIMYINGAEIPLDVPARLVGDRTLVPVRAISEGLKATVEWDDAAQRVLITTAPVQEPTPAPTLAPTPTPTAPTASASPSPEDGIDATSGLSAADQKKLEDAYGDMRYAFEYQYLPATLKEDPQLTADIIDSGLENIETAVRGVWDQLVVQQILQIQIDSETEYVFDGEEDTDQLLENYLSLVKTVDFSSEDLFDVSMEEVNGDPMVLLTFKRLDSLLACQYIGIVASDDDTIRYFTLESSITPEFFLCEVEMTAEGEFTHLNYGTVENTLDAFIKGIEEVLA